MHIECFAYFYKVAMAKSISKVANSSHISQSALSQQIQRLEETLGYDLLTRSNKGVELTDMGMIVLKYANNIVRTYNKMQEELANADRNSRKITIEASWPIANYALPCTLYDMKKRFPLHNYELKSNGSKDIIEVVNNGIADIGFVYGEPENQNVLGVEVGIDEVVLVAESSFDIEDSIDVKDLSSFPIIMLNDNVRIEEIIRKNLAEHNQGLDDLNILFSLDAVEAVKNSLSHSYGIAFIPYSAVKKELYHKQYKKIEIKGFDLLNHIYLVYTNQSMENEAVKEFIDAFKEVGNKSFC